MRLLLLLPVAVVLAGCEELAGLASVPPPPGSGGAPVVAPPAGQRPRAGERPAGTEPPPAATPDVPPGGDRPAGEHPAVPRPEDPPTPTVAAPRSGARKGIVEVIDFETGDVSQWRNPCGGGGCVEVSTEHTRAGRYAMKAVLPPGQERTEGAAEIVPPGSEQWYGWSVYVPEDWPVGAAGIISQVHAGGGFGASLQIIVEDEKIRMWRRFQPPGALGPQKEHSRREYREDVAPLQRGRWMDFVVHARWSHQEDGFQEVWMDGRSVWRVDGPVYFDLQASEAGPYFKAGLYGYGGSSGSKDRVVWVDEFRRGDASASYPDVAPGG